MIVHSTHTVNPACLIQHALAGREILHRNRHCDGFLTNREKVNIGMKINNGLTKCLIRQVLLELKSRFVFANLTLNIHVCLAFGHLL